MANTFLDLHISDYVAEVVLNRPEKANALDMVAFEVLAETFEALDENPDVRVIILRATGKHFCAGIDLSLLLGLNQHVQESCEGRKREKLRKLILRLQAPMNAVSTCSKPVLAAVQGGCIGGGLDLLSACDMRYATEEAYFTIKEIDMGMVADLGSLQRLPGIIGEGMLREMAYTGRKVDGKEAQAIGLVNKALPDQESLLIYVREIARSIAAKSPLSIRGSKQVLNHFRERKVAEGLEHIALWNAAMILSEDLVKAGQAAMQKSKPSFRD